MYWLTFLALSVVLYAPPLNLAQHLWVWAQGQRWRFLLYGWGAPPWLAYVWWLALAYLGLGTALHLAHRRLPEDSGLSRAAIHVSRAGLGALEVLMVAVALAVVVLAWPILPAARILFGWRHSISLPVAALAGLFLLAEALRIAENNFWADRAFAAQRMRWLSEHGYHQ